MDPMIRLEQSRRLSSLPDALHYCTFILLTMTTTLPKFTRALTIKEVSPQRKPLWHDAFLEQKLALPGTLKRGEILVRIGAAAFNHRDVAAYTENLCHKN